MPQTTLYARSGDAIGTVELSDELFAAPVNAAVMHQAVTAQLAGRHLGTHDTKTRGEVRGGGKKPYRQKGTGRARQGSRTAPALRRRRRRLRSPSALATRSACPRRMKRLALRGALTAKLDDGAIKVLDAFALDEIRTKDLVGVLGNLQASRPRADRGPRPATRSSTSRRATCPRSWSSSPTRSTSSTCSRPTRWSSSSPRSRASRRCTRDAHRPRRHRPADHQREVDGRVRPRQVHVRGPRRRHQDPGQGGRRGALQGPGDQGQRPRRRRPRRSAAAPSAGASPGWTTPWRKAIVTLAAGQKIEFFEGV